MGTSPVVIDVSHYQPTPNWQALLDAGILGVILKCTEGSSYVDDTFRARYDAAIEAGLAVSTYHFMRTGDLESQMNHYLNTLKPRKGERVCLDHEDPKVTLDYLESCVRYLLGDSRQLQIAIYSGHVIKEQLGNNRSSILADNTSLWLAQYSSTPSWPSSTWPQWALWQYTDQGKVPGISGNVDLNRFNGPDENCVAWLGPAVVMPPVPEPIPEPTPEPVGTVSMELTVPDGVGFTIKINGKQVYWVDQ